MTSVTVLILQNHITLLRQLVMTNTNTNNATVSTTAEPVNIT